MTSSGLLGRVVDGALDRSVVLGFSKVGSAVRRRLPGWPDDPAPDALVGRTVAVTGASSGLGIATAEGVARLGARVLLVVRDVAKGEKVLGELRGRVPGIDARVVRCDVGDLDDVRRCTNDLDVDRVDVLVHNAGTLPADRTESPQGHELTMAVHLLGPVLMTDRLRDRMPAGSRVVLVTSGGMYAQKLRADDPEYRETPYKGARAYARSKRAQVELLPLLAARWGGTTVAAMHPGWATTPGVSDSLPGFSKVMAPLFRTPDDGADTTVWLTAADPAPPTGRLWHDRRDRSAHMLPTTRAKAGERDRMWRWVLDSAGLTG